ncbi:MAG: hypothetical protein H0V76_10800 [Blastocatellia bacterium]|nr:hypothetical protein [Blastocatellia bacterium]
MHQGIISGIVQDRISGQPVSRALVAINHVEGSSERGGRLRLFNSRGMETGNIFTEAQDNGAFVLNFQWDALDLAHIISRPAVCHFNIGKPRMGGASGTTIVSYQFTRVHRNLSRAISLGSIANGTIPNPVSIPDCAGMAVDVYTAVRSIRVPMIGRTIMGPNAEALTLLGYFRFHI